MNHAEFIRKMAVETVEASPDELAVLLVIAERLSVGRVAYGPLKIGTDPRDWKLERRLELYDAMMYSAIAEVSADRKLRDELPTLPDATSTKGVL
ncbi:MAG TPA: hypothetical protein VH062_02450 [Polyangiaceae bacterium]|jgi:hypothetical protein|nr:hypothetical protein [Polyangiaceae bacterium]